MDDYELYLHAGEDYNKLKEYTVDKIEYRSVLMYKVEHCFVYKGDLECYCSCNEAGCLHILALRNFNDCQPAKLVSKEIFKQENREKQKIQEN